MDFELSDEQRLLTDSARAFAARELTPTPPSGIASSTSPSR